MGIYNLGGNKMEDKNKKGGKGKVVAIVAIVFVVVGLIVFFVMGAIKRSQGGPGQGPGQGPGKRPPKEGGSIESTYDEAESNILDDALYIAA